MKSVHILPDHLSLSSAGIIVLLRMNAAEEPAVCALSSCLHEPDEMQWRISQAQETRIIIAAESDMRAIGKGKIIAEYIGLYRGRSSTLNGVSRRECRKWRLGPELDPER